MNNPIHAATTSETMETKMNNAIAPLALSADANIVAVALAANLVASAGGAYRRDVDDAIWAATPALASLGAQEAAAIKCAVDFINCQQDPAAALHELAQSSLETLHAEPGVAA